MNNNRVMEIERAFFVDEMETEKFMLENYLENGFYRSVYGGFAVYEYQED